MLKAEKVWESCLEVEKVWESAPKAEKVRGKHAWSKESIQSVLKAERVLESASEVETVWDSALPSQIQLFSVHTISQMLFVQTLVVTFDKRLYGFLTTFFIRF